MEILVVDNDTASRQQTVAQLLKAGHRTQEATTALQAIQTLELHPVDLLMLDSHLPDTDVFELIRTVRATFSHWFPIVLLSDTRHEQFLADGIHAGADDYLLRPLSATLLIARLEALSRIIRMKQELDAANMQLKMLSTQDPLTGLLNRRGLDQVLSRAWHHHRQDKSELALMMIDIDQFKRYNDYYGHQQGDHCLRQVASLLEQSLAQPHGRLARYGGEEFMVILPGADCYDARQLASQILQRVKNAAILHPASSVASYLTLSIGISTSCQQADSCETLVSQADEALYLAKRYGRNREVCYGEIATLINSASSRPVAVG
ncbi:MAG: diguanylate cyclase [Marinobacterium sp.]|nr:diguanylate cyclase [Marinobacterium sp.]